MIKQRIGRWCGWLVWMCAVVWVVGGCKKKPLPTKIPKAAAKTEAEAQAEQEAIRRVKEAKTSKGFTVGAFLEQFLEATDKKVREAKGYPFDVQEWSARCELPLPQEIRTQRPLTEEERKRLLAGLPVEGVLLEEASPVDGGERVPKSRVTGISVDGGVASNVDGGSGLVSDHKKDREGHLESAADREGHHEGALVDGGQPAQEEPKPRFTRCEVSVILGASKEKATDHLKGVWVVGAKNIVPQDGVARMLMQEATPEDLSQQAGEAGKAEAPHEKSQAERIIETTDAGAISDK
ncbi:hypothetical protein L6R29_03850 [Myxococcota bacterium]|nr:hypothetical protein [Myxococcota bacterium]